MSFTTTFKTKLQFSVLCFFALVVTSLTMNAQVSKNEVLLISKEHSISSLNKSIVDAERNLPAVEDIQKISTTFDVFHLVFTDDISDAQIDGLQKIRGVEELWRVMELEKRNTLPNDMRLGQQWQLPAIQAFESWTVTTGGRTINNDEIVIAVMDEGIHIDHEDLAANLFTNTREIPGNGIDDDNNGYVDDYQGINALSLSGNHVAHEHGTNVQGVAGAVTNNEIGIAGLNWKIRVLPITNVTNNARIISALQYVLDMRKLYNDSDGQLGAYIVVTNLSAGIPEQFGSSPQNRIWCEFYDKLGEQGILSVCSAPNAALNIDEEGDMPSTCTSPFLISVTNCDENFNLVQDAGFGPQSVNIAAPGERIITTSNRTNRYVSFSGTSASAPLVASAVALLFSVDCEPFGELLKTDRSFAALSVKEALYNSVMTDPSLNLTSTGGVLMVHDALKAMQDPCEDQLLIPAPKGKLEIVNVKTEGGKYRVNYLSPDESPYVLQVYDTAGRLIYKEYFTPPQFGNKFLRVDDIFHPHGVYVFTIGNDKEVASKKVFLAGVR
jgi:subtilisin family serine protease